MPAATGQAPPGTLFALKKDVHARPHVRGQVTVLTLFQPGLAARMVRAQSGKGAPCGTVAGSFPWRIPRMLSTLLNRLLSPRVSRKKMGRRPATTFCRLTVERLEEREVMSSPGALAAPALGAALVRHAGHQAVAQVVPLSITGVSVVNGQLQASGLLGSQPFTAPLTLTTQPSATPGGTPILDLNLAPIDINLLGLEVKTSAICLDITAVPGSGNLLGNLLSGVANSLNSGTTLSNVLGGLTSAQTSQLTSGLTNLLNGALGTATAPSAVTGASTNVLHLSVGPVNLNLLGLNVSLDNCNNGPVTVDVIAHSGPGQLLGNLIGGLSHLLDSSASQTALTNKLDKIAGEILSLL